MTWRQFLWFAAALLFVAGIDDSATAATWAGVARSNVLVNSKCNALHYTLVTDGNKVRLHFEWPGIIRDVEADLKQDGTFATTYTSVKGDTVHVSGAIRGAAGTLSVGPKGSCGYKDIPLEK
jgi:hypothetical protein